MPTETIKRRLIDANALLEAIEKRREHLSTFDEGDFNAVCFGITNVTELIDSAPTVETRVDMPGGLGQAECFETAKSCFEAHPEKEWCLFVMFKINGELANRIRMTFIPSEVERAYLTMEEYALLESLGDGTVCSLTLLCLKR